MLLVLTKKTEMNGMDGGRGSYSGDVGDSVGEGGWQDKGGGIDLPVNPFEVTAGV